MTAPGKLAAPDDPTRQLLDNLGQLLDLLTRQRSAGDDPDHFAVKCLTLDEVARALKISRRSVDTLIALGELPTPLRLGDRILRIRVADLASCLAKRAAAYEGGGR